MQSINSGSPLEFQIPNGIDNDVGFFAAFYEYYNSYLAYGLTPKLKGELKRLREETVEYERTLDIGLNDSDSAKIKSRIMECKNTAISKVLKEIMEFNLDISEDQLKVILNNIEALGFVFGREGISAKRDISPVIHKAEYIKNFLRWGRELVAGLENKDEELLSDQEEGEPANGLIEYTEIFDLEDVKSPEHIFNERDFFKGQDKEFIKSVILGVSANNQPHLSARWIHPTNNYGMDLQILSYAREYLKQRAVLLEAFTQSDIFDIVDEETRLPTVVLYLDKTKEALERFLGCAFDLSEAEIYVLIETAIGNGHLLVASELLWHQINLESKGLTKPPENKYLIEDEGEFKKLLRFLEIDVSVLNKSAAEIQKKLESIKYSTSPASFDLLIEAPGVAEFQLYIHALIRYAHLRELKLSNKGNLIELKDLLPGDIDDGDQGDVYA